MKTTPTAAASFLLLLGHAYATTIGVYPVSLCPLNTTSSTPLATWEGTSSPNTQSTCPTAFQPASQRIFVSSLSYAQQNRPAYVPRSNTYALAVLRTATVTTTYLDFEITDATGKTLVPRTQVHLQPTPPPAPVLAESTDSPQLSSRRLLSDPPSTTTASPPKGKRSGRSAFRGRRKGKGGIMGGIGGGGRYGGGAGGFRAASGGSKSYGYSSGAVNARYAPGYSRTGYGYHGRSAMFVGAPLFLYSRGYGGRGFYTGCNQYSGEQKTECQGYYSSCKYSSTSNYSACGIKSDSKLVRDDIMAATIDSTKAVFPLNITVHRINVTFRAGSQPDPWANPVLLTFSEVDFDDENDADMEFWVFCLLMSIALVLLCAVVCFIWCSCCDGECCCDFSRSETENHPVSRTSSKVLEEVDLEAPKECCVVSTAPAPAHTTTVTVTGYYGDQNGEPEDKKEAGA